MMLKLLLTMLSSSELGKAFRLYNTIDKYADGYLRQLPHGFTLTSTAYCR